MITWALIPSSRMLAGGKHGGLGGQPVGSRVFSPWTQPSSQTPRRGCFSAFPLPGRPPNLVPAMHRLEGEPQAQSSPDASLPPPPLSLGRTSGPWAQAGTTVGQGRLGPAGSCSREPSGPRFLGGVSALDPPSLLLSFPFFKVRVLAPRGPPASLGSCESQGGRSVRLGAEMGSESTQA